MALKEFDKIDSIQKFMLFYYSIYNSISHNTNIISLLNA